MPRVVPLWRKYEKPSEKPGELPQIIVERHMLLAVTASEAIKNGKNAAGDQEWFRKEPKLTDADEIITVESKQMPVDSETRAERRKKQIQAEG